MKILLALKQIDFVLKMFAAAGFNNFAAAFEAKDANALKTHIDSIKSVEKIVEKVVEPSDAQITSLVSAELRELIGEAGFKLDATIDPVQALKDGLTAHNALVAKHALFETALTSCGIKLVAADAKVGLTAADITQAINNRVSIKAAELTAQLGTKPVEAVVTAAPGAKAEKKAGSEKAGVAGLAEIFKTAAH